jgi:hypothetical protein
MKTPLQLTLSLLAGLVLWLNDQSLHAAVTGHWDFNVPTDGLNATIGADLEYFDGSNGATQRGTEFGSTTSFGIPNIAGSPAQVMSFPTMSPTKGYIMRHGIPANGGGGLVNQWTLIMDVLYPASSSDEWRALIQSAVANPGNDDAEFYIDTANGVGINGTYHGNVPANTWVRLAIAVDMSVSPPLISKFINGLKIGEQNDGGLDSRFALSPTSATPNDFALLFTDGYARGQYTQPGYLNSLQIHDTKLTDVQIASLGAPTAAGIPTSLPSSPVVIVSVPGPGVDKSPGTLISATITNGTTQVVSNTVRLFLNGSQVPATISQGSGLTTVTYDPPGLFPAGSTNFVRLVYGDNTAKSFTNEYEFIVVQYQNITLPAPIYFENFDSTAEGGLPGGWSQVSYTDVGNPNPDLGDLNSASYATWLVVDSARFNGPLIGYSTPPPITDYQRVLTPNPANVVNGQVVENLAQGNIAFGNSGYRNGLSQVVYLFSPDFDLTAYNNVFLSYHSLWEQNQDSIGAVEYSIDEGATWLPVLYMVEEADVIRDGGGNIDALTTLNTARGDQPTYFDPMAGQIVGGHYGAFIGVASNQWSTLGPYISGRDDDNPRESKRVELFRLPAADHQAKVRLRFAHAGADSWYFGLDNVGLYQIGTINPPVVAPVQGQTAAIGNSATFISSVSGVGPFTYQWRFQGVNLAGQTNSTLTISNVQTTNAGSYSVVVSNSGGSVTSAPGLLTVIYVASPVTGQWDFNNGDLTATCGFDLEYGDGSVQASTTFGNTDIFGLPQIGGQHVRVMSVPFLSPMLGYKMFHGIHANGGGAYVNQYTLIMDVLYPAEAHNQWRAYLQTDPSNSGDAEFYANTSNAIGISGVYHGQLQANTWHRIAFAVDLSGPGPNPVVAKFIDGVKVGEQSLGEGTDGRWSMYTADDPATPYALVLAEPAGSTAPAYVSSIQIRSGRLSDASIVAMGGASPGKIPGAICIRTDFGTPIIGWSGTVLESAPALTGPWTPISGANKPYVVGDPSGAQRFYRSR